jgi:hypothetical protein
MELVEAPANDVNYGIDGGCKKEDNGVTQQDEFFSHTGFDDNLTLDNYTVARPNDPDYFLTQETEFDRDSGEFLMDYIATQEAEVLPPSIKRHIQRKVASSCLKSNKWRSRTNIHKATRPAVLSTQCNWTIVSASVDAAEEELFEKQSDAINSLFSYRCKQYVSAVQRKLGLKLQWHSLMECN